MEKIIGPEGNKSDNKKPSVVQPEKKHAFLKRSLSSKPIPTFKQSAKKTNFILSNKQQVKSNTTAATASEGTKAHASIKHQQKSILKKCNSKSNEFLPKSSTLRGSEPSCCSASSLTSLSKLKSKSVEDVKQNENSTVS